MLPTYIDITDHNVFREFEPDIFFPQDPYTLTDAFWIDMDHKCAIGGGTLSTTIQVEGDVIPVISLLDEPSSGYTSQDRDSLSLGDSDRYFLRVSKETAI